MQEKKKSNLLTQEERAFFQTFYDEHRNFMFFCARKYVSTQEYCEDIVQEATVRLINNIPTLRELTKNKTAKYIALTIRSVYLDNERRRHYDKSLYLSDDVLEMLIKAEVLPAASIPDLSAKLEVAQLKQSLSPRDWFVLEGKYILGYSQEELAQLLDVAPDSIRMILSRARKRARAILQGNDAKGGVGDA